MTVLSVRRLTATSFFLWQYFITSRLVTGSAASVSSNFVKNSSNDLISIVYNRSMDGIAKAYESAWQQLVKPARLEYELQDVGPDRGITSQGDQFVRKALAVVNAQG